MRIVITAGPTREYIDSVRFLSNASSGRMGTAVARAALQAGHHVTFLAGPIIETPPQGCEVLRFVSCDDLHRALDDTFPTADALIMAAAVGDFRPEKRLPTKLHRRNGPVTLRLYPTEDILAAVAADKTDAQTVIAFAVEEGKPEVIEQKVRREMLAKNADFTVVNTPAAMGSFDSEACILSTDGFALPWGKRPKDLLAAEIIHLLAD
jgi:phosphopantothenoylcysteine decarboxylase/phosphopantothenate--cysteine ligase